MGLPCFQKTTIFEGERMVHRWCRLKMTENVPQRGEEKQMKNIWGLLLPHSLALFALFEAKLLSTCEWGCCGFADLVQSD